MLRVFGDFESFYDREYSLRKMSPVEYILDRRWETLGCGIAIEHEDPMLLPQDEVARFLKDIKQPYCFISHNALFDACILSYRYGIRPAGLLCTLSMSRAVLLNEIPNGRLSLATVLKHIGLPPKGEFIHSMVGKHWRDLVADPGLLMQWTGYTLNDTAGCRGIFFHLRDRFPAAEALNMDRVIRMATEPRLCVDISALYAYYMDLKIRREQLLARVNYERSELMSNPQLATLLLSMGVEPPTKISLTTGKETWAFAKTDAAFMDLQEHPDPDVQTLITARLGLKTTIEETRTHRFIQIGERGSAWWGEPKLPCPLRFSGAHTHRLSGDWKLNMQNLSARKSKMLRTAIIAPPGYTIVAVDAAQIEARLTAWLAGQMNLLNQFANGEDVYSIFAAEIFRIVLAAVQKLQRFIGKQCILGLGFGMSARKLLLTIINLARDQKMDVGWITSEMCDEWVAIYRRKMRQITEYWGKMSMVLEAMARGKGDGITIGPCVVEGTTIIGPSGLRLYYNNLRIEAGEFWYDYGQFTKKIYGGKVFENVVQHLDRQHVTEAGIRTEMLARKLGIPDPRVLLNVHDENVHCVPDECAVTLAELALAEMKRNVEWSDGLPLDAEVKLGKNFGEMEKWSPSP